MNTDWVGLASRGFIVLVALVLSAVTPVSAQVVRSPGFGPAGGIAVIGRASERVRADGLRIEATVQGDADPAERESILARLRGGGIESPQLLITPYVTQSGSQTIVRGILRHANEAKLADLAKLAGGIFADHSKLRLQSASLIPFLDDCSAVDARVRAAALDDARKRAASIAKSAGVTLGGVAAVTESGSTCVAGSDLARFGQGAGGFPLELEPAVYVTISENVTFAIK
jgi:uncharacterized protein YggE